MRVPLRLQPATASSRKRTRCSECLGALAHRLSQPLTALHGSLELALLEHSAAGACRAELERLLKITQQAVRMVVALGEWAEALTPHPGTQRIQLGTMIREAMEEVRCLADSREVRMKLQLPRALPVWGDTERLREVLLRSFILALGTVQDKSLVRIRLLVRQGTAFLNIYASVAEPSACGIRPRPATPGQLFAAATKAACPEWMVLQSLAQSMGGDLLFKSGHGHELRLSIQLPRAV